MHRLEHNWTALLLKLGQGRTVPHGDRHELKTGTDESSGC